MNSVFLLIGGNLGNRLQNLEIAKKEIAAKIGQIQKTSSVYETAPWGIAEQPNYLNQVVLVHSTLLPEEVLQTVLNIETTMGRSRKEKYGPRIIDIDILFYNDEIVSLEQLTIPHPEIQNRRFVLIPLAELNAGFIHPLFNISIAELLERCPDSLAVSKHYT